MGIQYGLKCISCKFCLFSLISKTYVRENMFSGGFFFYMERNNIVQHSS